MAKKQVPEKRNGTPQKSPQTKGISKTTTTINKKNEERKVTTDDDASGEETEDDVSSSLEPENDDSEEDVVEKRSSSNEEEQETLISTKKKSKKSGVKNKGEKRSKKDEGESEEENNENNLYRFPMNRVSRIIKSEMSDLKIAQDAVFVINRATERFLQVFCREAYACAFLDNKKCIAYNHLSSVVSRRKRLKFLSDFVPEKVKAEDALALISKAEE